MTESRALSLNGLIKVNAHRSSTLTSKELYNFDCTGLLKFPGLLDGRSTELCKSEILAGSSRLTAGRGDKRRYDDLTKRSKVLADLAEDPRILNYVEPLINQPLRLVESYGLLRGPDSNSYLHNGNSEHVAYGKDRLVRKNMGFSHSYHDGKLYCMLVKVIFYFEHIKTEEDGPFCYLEGSHKANFALFENTIRNSHKLALTKENFPTMQHVYTNPGDVVIINEALLHGALGKSTPEDRLIMAFTYAPCFVSDWKPADISSKDIYKLGHY
jgi:hypothetical protein